MVCTTVVKDKRVASATLLLSLNSLKLVISVIDAHIARAISQISYTDQFSEPPFVRNAARGLSPVLRDLVRPTVAT